METTLTPNPIYEQQFVDYLRYGTEITADYYCAIHRTYAKKYIEQFYIWRTQKDAKVRAAHAINEGVVFSYDRPPPTGAPGKAKNCRCFAEDIFATMPLEIEPYIDMWDTSTWPKPPINGKFSEALSKRNKAGQRGEKILYDQYGARWRIHKDDRHNTHWDYQTSRYKFAQWLNIPINNKPTKLPEE